MSFKAINTELSTGSCILRLRWILQPYIMPENKLSFRKSQHALKNLSLFFKVKCKVSKFVNESIANYTNCNESTYKNT